MKERGIPKEEMRKEKSVDMAFGKFDCFYSCTNSSDQHGLYQKIKKAEHLLEQARLS